MVDEKFLQVKKVMEITGLSRSSIYRREKKGDFPKRRRLSSDTGGQRIAWLKSEIMEWVRNRPVVNLGGDYNEGQQF